MAVAQELAARPVLAPDVVKAGQECLRRSPYAAVRNVSCEDRHGVLFLRGQVSSYYHKQVAQEAVARLAGVARIVNALEVTRDFRQV